MPECPYVVTLCQTGSTFKISLLPSMDLWPGRCRDLPERKRRNKFSQSVTLGAARPCRGLILVRHGGALQHPSIHLSRSPSEHMKKTARRKREPFHSSLLHTGRAHDMLEAAFTDLHADAEALKPWGKPVLRSHAAPPPQGPPGLQWQRPPVAESSGSWKKLHRPKEETGPPGGSPGSGGKSRAAGTSKKNKRHLAKRWRGGGQSQRPTPGRRAAAGA